MPANLPDGRLAVADERSTRTTRDAADAREAHLHALMVAAQAGGAAAYRDFLRDTATLVRGFLRRRLSRLPDDIEDLVQETLLAVHNQRRTYDPAQPVTAWLHAIARYKLVDLLRRRARTVALHDPIDDVDEGLLSADAHEGGVRRDLEKLLALLPDKQRLPIVYMKLEGLSVIETAQRTGLSESAVKVGVHRGLKVLAAKLRASGDRTDAEG
ncbi:MAG: sigma-70 family RNA polymerase sigma factor [Burkholderiaceae bacterium]|nr:sigma-70 family RNA polymerase sigma factor [Burkholderiaceae bacterium]